MRQGIGMYKTIAILASVAALSYASGAQATGSHGSFFYHGGGYHDGDAEEDHDGPPGGICNRIHNNFLRKICHHVAHEHEHPASA